MKSRTRTRRYTGTPLRPVALRRQTKQAKRTQRGLMCRPSIVMSARSGGTAAVVCVVTASRTALSSRTRTWHRTPHLRDVSWAMSVFFLVSFSSFFHSLCRLFFALDLGTGIQCQLESSRPSLRRRTMQHQHYFFFA
mmetsp:Transcript_43428/g.114460  ORF Transcript_43428/g.114460 Transcript_43428/m.114460 type:complete len:137 (-) Transcript_43428:492-902(-)